MPTKALQDNKKSTTGEPQDRRPASAYSDDADPIREITYDGETYTTRPARLVTDIDALEAMRDASSSDNPVIQAGALARITRSVLADDFDRFRADQAAKHGFCSIIALQEIVEAISQAEGNSPASPIS